MVRQSNKTMSLSPWVISVNPTRRLSVPAVLHLAGDLSTPAYKICPSRGLSEAHTLARVTPTDDGQVVDRLYPAVGVCDAGERCVGRSLQVHLRTVLNPVAADLASPITLRQLLVASHFDRWLQAVPAVVLDRRLLVNLVNLRPLPGAVHCSCTGSNPGTEE